MSPEGQYPDNPSEHDTLQDVPKSMREIRIVSATAPIGTKEEPDPDKVVVLSYDKFRAITNELKGAGMSSLRRFGQKIEEAVSGEAIGQFHDQLQLARAEGYAAGKTDGIQETLAMQPEETEEGPQDPMWSIHPDSAAFIKAELQEDGVTILSYIPQVPEEAPPQDPPLEGASHPANDPPADGGPEGPEGPEKAHRVSRK